ncbi:response regulator transcription factor [Mangrovimonas sp. YM274]|uniref:response regulator transcription factor n=1 Tax=Mangrovimonas sp. YM274 TaxID=3070660 RepID=UPI0027DE2643|nr:response regulator transcription factor [Mangrovimonas sp. YM274]WMI69189.1 response regulator transcription factor [Mangrovimonas sp. YM274]
MKNILLAEDDHDFGGMLTQYLQSNKFNVEWAKNGEEALELFNANSFHICVLDVMMPKMDGFTLAKRITQVDPEMPFLYLTARKTKEDKIKGLKLGADDYIVKPFDPEEFVLRLKNIIKRTEQQQFVLREYGNQDIISIGSYRFDYRNSILKSSTTTHSLTKKEAQLIYFLYKNKNKLVRREDILTKIWNTNDFFSGRSMDVYISKVRKYFNEDEDINIKSIRGLGLEFQLPTQA